MKIVVFGPDKRVGALVDNKIVDLNKADSSLPSDLLAFIEKRAGAPIPHKKADWRPGDQRCYVSDIRKAQAELGWTPRDLDTGLAQTLGVA